MDTLKYFVLTGAIKQICLFTSHADEGLLIPSPQSKIEGQHCISIQRNMRESRFIFAVEGSQNICSALVVNFKTSCRQWKAKVLKQLVKLTLILYG